MTGPDQAGSDLAGPDLGGSDLAGRQGLDLTAAPIENGWHAIARSDDAPLRHVYQTELLGRELAVWRADDGYLNVWDNRCLHRGVRLSIGSNEGSELKCVYHGWRYSSRTGGCTYIPAHPGQAPARTLCTRVFPAQERYGLVWANLGSEVDPGGPEPIEVLDDGAPFALRSLPVNASPLMVMSRLGDYRSDRGPGFEAEQEPTVTMTPMGPLSARVTSVLAGVEATVVFFVQPVDAGRVVVRGVLAETPTPSLEIQTLRHHAEALEQLRQVLEAAAGGEPRPAPLEAALQRVEIREPVSSRPGVGDDARVEVVVERKAESGRGVMAFELAPVSGELPTTQPGAHIDVFLPNGLVRQYSLTNRAGDQGRYVIGVKREADSRGGSAVLHDSVSEGDVLTISAPRNTFSLRRDARHTILVAGGIGLTPLLAMAETLNEGGHSFELHYFARSADHVAFAPRLGRLGPAATAHLGLSPVETGEALQEIVARHEPSSHLYICGPGPMLDAARQAAGHSGWPDPRVHFEYFKNSNELDRSHGFELTLARSGLTVFVGPGETILDVLRANDIDLPSSCEQGACGTCVLGVIEGRPDHQDVYLNASERESGERIVACVSRSVDDRLVLDL